MIASTEPQIVEAVDSVLDLRAALEAELADGNHEPAPKESQREASIDDESEVQQHLEDLGYM